MQIPGDALGRSWVQYELRDWPRINGALLTLMTHSESGEIRVIGNGFLIYGHEHGGLCLTAAHNFEEIRRLQPPKRAHPHPTLAPDFRQVGPRYLDTSNIVAVCVLDAGIVSCRVGKVSYIENYDVAVSTIHAPDNAPFFRDCFAVSLRMPKVGEQICLLTHGFTANPVGNGLSVERSHVAAAGIVTSVTKGLARLGGASFTIETTIPFRPGWSGAPVLTELKEGGSMIVCAVASYDFSPDAAFENFRISGHSTASVLWPAMGLGFEMNVEGAVTRPALLGDLLERKLLDDRSRTVSVHLQQTERILRLLYKDADTHPEEIVLEVTKHPDE